jgi:hypothetical protein
VLDSVPLPQPTIVSAPTTSVATATCTLRNL